MSQTQKKHTDQDFQVQNQVGLKEAPPERLTWLDHVVTFSRRFNDLLMVIAGIALVASMLLVVSNAIIRVFFEPFGGTVEVVGWLAAIATSFALGYTQLQKGHVYITLLTDKFPQALHNVVYFIVLLLSIAFFVVLSWQLWMYGLQLQNSGTLSTTLRIAFYPILFVVSIGFLGLIFSLVTELVTLGRREKIR